MKAGTILFFAAGATFAANYQATVNYEKPLFYKVVDTKQNAAPAECRSAARGINLNTNSLAATEISFYNDRDCKDQIVSVNAADLFGNDSRISTTLNADGTFSRAPGANQPSRKTIAFLPPWSNTSAKVFVAKGDNLDSTTMTAVKNYCGWFSATVTPSSNLRLYFRQTVGMNYLGAEGMTKDEPTIANEIVLDTFPNYASADTIWIQGYKTDAPAVFFKYPGVLGDCPLKKFPVTMIDWLHGPKDNDGDAPGKNGDPANGVSADFGSGGCSTTNIVKGMVKKELGPNGVPVPADPFPTNCKISTHLDHWFIPEVLKDDKGNEFTNMACRNLYISLDKEGMWLAEVSKDNISEGNEANEGGMFLLDDFEYLDEDTKTFKNPYFDQEEGSDKKLHNFGFTMKIQATFEYVEGQYFDFLGDDDVWVFINNKLAVDIGGQHAQKAGAVSLDTLGLVPGKIYNFHIFYVERHTGSSNFKMRTSIDLQVDASIFVTNYPEGDITNYNVWQVNRKSKFACGNDINSKDTTVTGGPSTFRLTGGNLSEPQILEAGKIYFEGINITSDSTFSVNVEAIKAGGALAPGHYFLEITLKSDPSQSTKVEITVPAYDLPSVAFAKADWTILGTNVSGDTLQIGEWAYATYQVNISFFEEWATVNNYNKKINLSFSDVNIDILDTIGGKKINSVTLNSEGRATFYIHANRPVTGASLTVKGAAAGSSIWTNLNFAEPPIPQVVNAIITDRNGDGRGDSLFVAFDRSLTEKSTLDSIQFEFGEAFMATNKFKVDRNYITLVAEDMNADKCNDKTCGFGSRQFTGGASDVYVGSLNNWFTYKDNGKASNFYKENEPINDGMGPIVVSAVKSKSSDGNRHLSLTFSEAISDDSRKMFASMFEFICMRAGVNEKPEAPVQQGGSGNTMILIYSSTTQDAVLPTNGDMIRFVPGNGLGDDTQDLLGNTPHKDNVWATITGDQELGNESPGVIAVGEDPYGIIRKDTITQSLLITNASQDAQQIGDSLGVQGSLIDYDISKIMLEETQKAINALDAFVESKLGSTTTYDTTISCITEEEALAQVFADIRAGIVGENFNFTEETVIAIMEGSITESNFQSKISAEEKSIIAKLTQDNIEASWDTVITLVEVSTITQSDLFAAIREGKMDEELKAAGVSQVVIDAIKNGTLDEYNIEEYRNGSKSLIPDDAVELYYRTRYYSQFGEYVGGTSNSIKCSDESVFGAGGCLQNKGKIFLAWNMRSNSGRLVGTGVYIARLELKIIVNGETTMHQTRDKLWGVRRGSINKLGLEFR